MKKLLICAFTVLLSMGASYAIDGLEPATPEIESDDFIPIEELLNTTPADTQCATAAFANALAQTVGEVSEEDHETDIQAWIYKNFSRPDVLQTVLACPEIANAPDEESIKFIPIEYTFPGGRKIVVNYETQPKILKQRLSLASKRTTPGGDNPRIGTDGAEWTHTDPAWYGIMVVQSGALDKFAGADKNNTISLQYIKDNIDDLYPKGWSCTSKSALAPDSDTINRAVHKSVNIEDDTNDYYVAGDVNLQWISYLEIALDVAITVVTFGGGTVILGATKAARASRAMKGLASSMRALSKLDSVRDYIRISQKYAKATEELKNINRLMHPAAYARKQNEIKNLSKSMRQMEKADKNVRQYKQSAEAFADISKYRRGLRAMRTPQRGNILARAFRSVKAAYTGNQTISRGAKVARSSMKSGKIRDWLFHSTLKNAGKLAKMEAAGGLLYGALKFAGDMYDWTETSTGDFTNGIEFQPLLLLSADDLQGQENVVNYGMWLMWAGDAVSAADDDAAYLQALDFAEKFYQDLNETQEQDNDYACDVDIYVVRPVLRNPGDEDAELYYLIMNDTPWSTAKGTGTPQCDTCASLTNTNGDTSQTTAATPDVVNNHTVRGGPCTPSAVSDRFPNQILTTGRYAQTDPAFEKAMIQVFRMEGQCGQLPNDPGGYTCYGIAQNAWPNIDVRTLTRETAEDFYYNEIYKKMGFDRLPDYVRGDIFRAAMGGCNGLKVVRKRLGLTPSCAPIDDELVRATEQYAGDLHNDIWDAMEHYYKYGSSGAYTDAWVAGAKLMRENGCHVRPARELGRQN